MALNPSEAICQIAQSQTVSAVDTDVQCCASEFYSYSTTTILELPIDTLDAMLSSDSLKVIDEDWLLNILLEVGVDYCFLCSHLRLEYLSSEGITRFCDSIDYLHPTEEIWKSVVNRLKGFCDDNFQMHRSCVESVPRFESNIISTFPDIRNEFRNRKLKLLSRRSRDGFRSSAFHRKYDGQSNTITFIQTTKHFIFGGYTPLSWDSMSGYKADSSHRSFVFTMTHPHNFVPRKFALKLNCSQYAIRCTSSYGPTFGSGHTIGVGTNFTATNSSYTRFSGYMNDTGLDDTIVFTGEYTFTVKEMEVFTLTE
jgi:hypothetical protein